MTFHFDYFFGLDFRTSKGRTGTSGDLLRSVTCRPQYSTRCRREHTTSPENLRSAFPLLCIGRFLPLWWVLCVHIHWTRPWNSHKGDSMKTPACSHCPFPAFHPVLGARRYPFISHPVQSYGDSESEPAWPASYPELGRGLGDNLDIGVL